MVSDDSRKKRWRLAQLARQDDAFARGFSEAMQIRGVPGPPERRPSHAVGRWFKRGKLWDDIFTRTVANVLSLGILAVLAALTGLIHFDRQAWAAVALVAGLLVAVAVVNVAPVRYFRHQRWRWIVFGSLVILTLVIAWRLYGSLPAFPAPTDSNCQDNPFC